MKIRNKTKITKSTKDKVIKYLLDINSPTYVPNDRSVKWTDDDGLTYKCSSDLWNIYLNGNVKVSLGFDVIKDFMNQKFIDLFIYLTDLTKSDLELIYELCFTGTHHNGRDIDWLEKEGLRIDNGI